MNNFLVILPSFISLSFFSPPPFLPCLVEKWMAQIARNLLLRLLMHVKSKIHCVYAACLTVNLVSASKMLATRAYVRSESDKAGIGNIYALMSRDSYNYCTFLKCFQAAVDEAWFFHLTLLGQMSLEGCPVKINVHICDLLRIMMIYSDSIKHCSRKHALADDKCTTKAPIIWPSNAV